MRRAGNCSLDESCELTRERFVCRWAQRRNKSRDRKESTEPVAEKKETADVEGWQSERAKQMVSPPQ